MSLKHILWRMRLEQNNIKRFSSHVPTLPQYGNNAYIAPQASMSDGLMDVVIMEPFDVIEASQVSFDMFNKTLDKNSKIKSSIKVITAASQVSSIMMATL